MVSMINYVAELQVMVIMMVTLKKTIEDLLLTYWWIGSGKHCGLVLPLQYHVMYIQKPHCFCRPIYR